MLLFLTLSLFLGIAYGRDPVLDDRNFTKVGSGICKPTGCVKSWSDCQVNGYYRDDWSDDYSALCYHACIADENCIGFSWKRGSSPKCFVYTNTHEAVPAGWTAQVTEYTDIFTWHRTNPDYQNYECWMTGRIRRTKDREVGFGHQKIDLAESEFCGHQLPGDNHYGACDGSAVASGVKAKKFCQVTGEGSGIPGDLGNKCQASMHMGAWANVDCARHASEDPECGGSVFWITGEMFNDQWYTNYELTSCACLLEGVTLDDVELTSEVGARVYVFDPEVDRIAAEEPKYKLIHPYANFNPNVPVCGHIIPGDYAAGPCTVDADHQVKSLCNALSGPQGSCTDYGITDVATCAAAVVADADCAVTFVADAEGEFAYCACVYHHGHSLWSPWHTVDLYLIQDDQHTNLYTFYPGTSWGTYFPTTQPSNFPSAVPTTSDPTQLPTMGPSVEPTVGPTSQPATSVPTLQPTTSIPTFSPVPEPTPGPTLAPSEIPTSQPSEHPTPAPSHTSRRRDVPFLNAFDDIVGSEENLDEFLISCTDAIRSIFEESTTSCVNAWTIVFDQMMISIQDYCGSECHSLDSDEDYISKYGLKVSGFGQLYTESTGSPNPTFAPTMTDAPSASTTPAPTASCAVQTVDVVVAVSAGYTVDWSLTEEAVTITAAGAPEPAACYADSGNYYGPEEGEAPIPYQETCCLPGGQYTLTCLASFDWGDSSVSINGKEYCRGLNGEMQSHIVHIEGPVHVNPDGGIVDVNDLVESGAGVFSILVAATVAAFAL